MQSAKPRLIIDNGPASPVILRQIAGSDSFKLDMIRLRLLSIDALMGFIVDSDTIPEQVIHALSGVQDMLDSCLAVIVEPEAA